MVVFDSVPTVDEKYWQTSYVGTDKPGERFSFETREASAAPGTLEFLVGFNNGAVTVDGKELGLAGSYDRKYQVSGGGQQFASP